MTIRRGEPWGSVVGRPTDLVVANSDAALAAFTEHDPGGAFAVDGGDLHRTVGAPRSSGPTVHRLPIDLLEVVTDRSRHTAVAHVVIRRRWWRGPVVFVCNVDHVGSWNVAPRAHPNDGRFDVVEVAADMTLRDRWEARRRLTTGTHLPHPSITVRTAIDWTWVDPSGATIVIDGVDVGPRTSVHVTIRPDATAIHV